MVSDVRTGPALGRDRHLSVDALRGFAVLGILLMNALVFALPHSGGWVPYPGGRERIDLALWCCQVVLWDGKLRAIFSMLFGAGLLMFTERAARADAGADAWFRRSLWLLTFGMAHAYLIWAGDILFDYAVAGLLIFPFRKLRPKALLLIAVLLVLGRAGIYLHEGFKLRTEAEQAQAADAVLRQGGRPTPKQARSLEDWTRVLNAVRPAPQDLQEQDNLYQSGYARLALDRAPKVERIHSLPLYSPIAWDWLSMMFLGMALYKLGVFTLERSTRFYAALALAGAGFALPLNALAAALTLHFRTDPARLGFPVPLLELGRGPLALAYVGAFMVALRRGWCRGLTRRLAAVGRMALSNYVLHSLVFTTLFYGYGFGLFGRLDRLQVYGIVLAVWAFQLAASPLWLRAFHFGPLEWCWRSLTYWKRQPMRRSRAAPAGVVQEGA